MSGTKPLALAFPLKGSQLIEASAGTGKTFTISALYLRLVLGHGGDESGFGRELLPPQILVVTFTDAATKELRERIRIRLAEAARFFREEIEEPDALIAELRDQYSPEQWPGCAWLLTRAMIASRLSATSVGTVLCATVAARSQPRFGGAYQITSSASVTLPGRPSRWAPSHGPAGRDRAGGLSACGIFRLPRGRPRAGPTACPPNMGRRASGQQKKLPSRELNPGLPRAIRLTGGNTNHIYVTKP